MAQQQIASVENNFTGGLKTEYTGLNFPENAATDTDNCVYEITGNVNRRLGFDLEEGFHRDAFIKTNKALSNYLWYNAGGDGITTLLVEQWGEFIQFYVSSDTSSSSSLSNHLISSSVNLADFQVSGSLSDIQGTECEYAAGNGYLFIFNQYCDPVYVTYKVDTQAVTAQAIAIRIRDFTGVIDNLPVDSRPGSLSNEHKYNLINQGWTQGSAWSYIDTGLVYHMSYGIINITGQPGQSNINLGDQVRLYYRGAYPIKNGNTGATITPGDVWGSGNVTSYVGSNIQVNVTYVIPDFLNAAAVGISVAEVGAGYISSWNSAIGNYPSNSDVWWYFKNSSDVFDPGTTLGNVTSATGNAPRGHVIIDAFNQDRSAASNVSGINPVVCNTRPSTGCWFQGRIWYTGVNAQQQAALNTDFYTWSQNIYFSNIVNSSEDLGNCFQTNDPTSENLFDLLPTDGGVIKIPEAGQIFKLFPIQNGLLVFCSNGIWFITGSQGIGFAANDYTITKISSVQCISGKSFVNVQGLPYFWNEEGIYSVTPSQQGLGLQVEPLTVSTILSYYNNIPNISKRYVRGDYDPINYVVQWCFKSTPETDITSRYEYDKILCYNTYNKAFYPYSFEDSTVKLHNVVFIPSHAGSSSPDPIFKYQVSFPEGEDGTDYFTFAEERDDTSYLDWNSIDPTDYESYFITGYKLHGQGQRRFQVDYIYVYSGSEVPSSYKIQCIWDYANDRNSGKYTTIQLVTNALTRFSRLFRRHRIRGRGLVLQFKVSSVTGFPFDINGWSVSEKQNSSI